MTQTTSDYQNARSEQMRAERKAKWFWVSLIVLLLGLQLAIGGVALVLATGDASAAIIPNYHEAALNWDQARRERTAAQRLGWDVDLDVSDVADGNGLRAMRLYIKDRFGMPINHLDVTVTFYHLAHGNDIQELKIQPIDDGGYQAMASMPRTGLWQVNLNIKQMDETIAIHDVIEL
ncbi:MAG: FixH family protein [Pirellulaceae bacterium]